MTKWQIVRRLWVLVTSMEADEGLSVLWFAMAVRDRDRKRIFSEALKAVKRIQK